MLLQRFVNAPEEFTFGAAEKEATIRDLREEVRIVRARMENNPDVKRYAGASSGPCTESLAQSAGYKPRRIDFLQVECAMHAAVIPVAAGNRPPPPVPYLRAAKP